MEHYKTFTDEELTKEWNYLETKKLTPQLEETMDWIQEYLRKDRKVVAWNNDGKITYREDEHGLKPQ